MALEFDEKRKCLVFWAYIDWFTSWTLEYSNVHFCICRERPPRRSKKLFPVKSLLKCF
jgi:hypothetical protein